jgi:hypothetical protein
LLEMIGFAIDPISRRSDPCDPPRLHPRDVKNRPGSQFRPSPRSSYSSRAALSEMHRCCAIGTSEAVAAGVTFVRISRAIPLCGPRSPGPHRAWRSHRMSFPIVSLWRKLRSRFCMFCPDHAADCDSCKVRSETDCPFPVHLCLPRVGTYVTSCCQDSLALLTTGTVLLL